MKFTTAIFAMFLGFSTGALACPDLSGTYVCGQDEMSVETFELDGVHYLEFNGQGGLPADGQWLSIPDSESEKNGKIRLTCGSVEPYGDHFLMDYEADVYDKGKYLAFVDAELYLHMDGENLLQTVTGTAKGSWGEQPIDEVTVCNKK